MDVTIEPTCDLRATDLAPLVAEADRAGWRFVRRLVDEWASGVNRFAGPGEALFLARAGGVVVGVCGLTQDPYASDPTVGRVRRLYVLEAVQGRGVGRRLVEAVLRAAVGRFRTLRVRTENPTAGRLYERLGFRPTPALPDCTHVRDVGPIPEADR